MAKNEGGGAQAVQQRVTYSREDCFKLIDLIFAEVEGAIIEAIRQNAGNDRTGLLAQLDTITKCKERVYARSQYSNPAGSS